MAAMCHPYRGAVAGGHAVGQVQLEAAAGAAHGSEANAAAAAGRAGRVEGVVGDGVRSRPK